MADGFSYLNKHKRMITFRQKLETLAKLFQRKRQSRKDRLKYSYSCQVYQRNSRNAYSDVTNLQHETKTQNAEVNYNLQVASFHASVSENTGVFGYSTQLVNTRRASEPIKLVLRKFRMFFCHKMKNQSFNVSETKHCQMPMVQSMHIFCDFNTL